ncbi:MAG: PEP-CTERM sorting domain-containing protein [Phycisphaerae bacterium]|nr:PEP-CTERM sorting domain-containing protein [Phycisphaerae bacterium]
MKPHILNIFSAAGCWSVAGLLLTTMVGKAQANTVTVLNFSENGPADMAASGNTPAKMFSVGGNGPPTGFTLSGNNAFSQEADGVSPLGSDVALESLDVFVAQSGGEGAVGRSDVVGGELENIGDNQVYVAELLDSNNAEYGPANLTGFSAASGAVATSFGHGFSSFAGASLVNGPAVPKPPPTPVPEPATLALLAVGGGLLLMRRRTT